MIAVGDGLCSDERVIVGRPYLARIADKYLVVTPLPYDANLKPTECDSIPWCEAWWDDVSNGVLRPFTDLHEACPIY